MAVKPTLVGVAKKRPSAAALKKQMANEYIGHLVDEIGKLESELAPAKAKLTRLENFRRALARQIREVLHLDPEKVHTLPGEYYLAVVGVADLKRHLTPQIVEEVAKAVSEDEWYKFCAGNLGVGAFEELMHTTKKEIELPAERTGNRRIQVAAKMR